MDEDRIASVEKRLDDVEQDLQKLRKTVHDVKNEQQVMVGQINAVQKSVTSVEANTETLLHFFEGTDKLFGFCRKHWRTLLKFGCGFVTAYGVTNPSVQRTLIFVQHFFGL